MTICKFLISAYHLKSLQRTKIQLLEPCTELVVTVTEEHLGSVLSDLTSQRRAQVKEVSVATETRVIHALAPLAGLMVSFN